MDVIGQQQYFWMDSDEELLMLQRELMEVQEEKTNPLSERTVAEIMLKLYHQGFKFIPTTDANQYLTPSQLDHEICTLLKERFKLPLHILPSILNVNLDIIENRIQFILANHHHHLHFHNGNFIHHKYLELLAVNIKQQLEREGIIELDDISRQHEFSGHFTEKFIEIYLPEWKAQRVGNQLITKDYSHLKEAKILGFLQALTCPISMDQFMKVNGVEQSNIWEIIQKLIKAKRLNGRLENGYFVPSRFSSTQNKIINNFYRQNQYLQASMLQSKFLISKPLDWISKHLEGKYILLDNLCISPLQIQSFSTQITSMLQTEGFFELSTILPFQLSTKNLEKLLKQHCNIHTEFIFVNTYIYSNDWIDKCLAEFKEKIIFSIFFKKLEKPKKKGKKEEKQKEVTEQELIEILFNSGLASYDSAENIAESFLPLLVERLEEMKKRVEKELALNKGFINSNFLKFKSCKTILKTEESLSRTLNQIGKQKKVQVWEDPEFGPSAQDQNGQFSLIYYDKALPKGWASFEDLTWKPISVSDLLHSQSEYDPNYMKKSLIAPLAQILEFHSQKQPLIQWQINALKKESCSPFVFRFFITETEKRYVLVDNKLPFCNERPFAGLGKYSLLEKAYAKLRYCYKATLNVGFHQILFDLIGIPAQRFSNEHDKGEEIMIKILEEQLAKNNLVILLGQGEIEKSISLDGKDTPFTNLKPYCIYQEANSILIFPRPEHLQVLPSAKDLMRIFKNMYVVSIR